jgi:short-subunit dehydrogenase
MKEIKKQLALITGASSGIGYELALIFASRGVDLILVSRDAEKLKEVSEALSSQYKISVMHLAKDLSDINQTKQVFDFVVQGGLKVDYLVNNAGFGVYGEFLNTDVEKEISMINLNVTALTYLSKMFGKLMAQNKKGRILNLASTASFSPGPLMAVYYATKAYVLSFSQALQNELAPYGVKVTTLCPGPTISGFQKAANMEYSKLIVGQKLPTSREVAQFGYDSMMRGRGVVIHGFFNWLKVEILTSLPRGVALKLIRFYQGSKH